MYLVSLACMVMSLVSSVLTFTPSETDWTAPGVEVEELACIDLLAYGEPINWPNDRSDNTHLACQVFFVETDEGIKWRVDIVYRDKVVMLEQDSEPVEFYPGFNDCRYAIFSANGRYVMVGAEIGTEDYPECVYTLIDLEGETGIRLQRTFERAKEPVFWVSTDGSVAMLAHGRRRVNSDSSIPYSFEAPDTLYLYDNELNQSGYHVTPIGYPRVRISDDGKTIVALMNGTELVGIDSSGSEIWSRSDIGSETEGRQIYGLHLSGDGSLFLSSRLSGAYAYDAQTGTHQYTVEGYCLNNSVAISESGEYWGASYGNRVGQDPFEYYYTGYIITYKSNTETISVAEIHAVDAMCNVGMNIRTVFDDGAMIMQNNSIREHKDYLYLLEGNGEMCWQSQLLTEPSTKFWGNVGASWGDLEPNASCRLEDGRYLIAYITDRGLIVSSISCAGNEE